MKSTIEIVAQLYAEFGEGNIAAILEKLADDVTWELPASANVPFSGVFTGKNGVVQFFEAVASTNDFQEFTIEKLLGDAETVVAFGNLKAIAKTTGKTSVNKWAHRWDFNNGQIVRHYEYADTAEILSAFS
ncbi:MAG: nuclear transport factor 2 family protein [Spirosomataceae bacterium]